MPDPILPAISVVIAAHNPDPTRLRETLLGLRAQTLPLARWETLLVDNASTRWPAREPLRDAAPANLLQIREPELGLSAARRRGLDTARADYVVLVDDDNVLAPEYLANVVHLFEAHPRLGAVGGLSRPRFEQPPPPWTSEFHSLLALRDLGEEPLISQGLRPPGASRNEYPECSPIGAGMALRRAAVQGWLDGDNAARPSDRRGTSLASSGDNDLVLAVLEAGWEVGYFPSLALTHLIPSARLSATYLARLNRAMQESWMRVLALHDANPWPPLTPTGAALRRLKAWFTYRPWTSAAARVRYAGACGHFAGRVPLTR